MQLQIIDIFKRWIFTISAMSCAYQKAVITSLIFTKKKKKKNIKKIRRSPYARLPPSERRPRAHIIKRGP